MIDNEMIAWIDQRLELACQALESARNDHSKMVIWREQIINGNPSPACSSTFWNWRAMQPRNELAKK